MLNEKGVTYDLAVENPWEQSDDFLALNPAGEVPVLVLHDLAEKQVITDHQAICEYLDETYTTKPSLIGVHPLRRAEVRRIAAWFDRTFFVNVSLYIYGEKALKRLAQRGEPDSMILREGYIRLREQLEMLGTLIEQHKWIAGEEFSLADITAWAHLSVLDYMGDVPWDDHQDVKAWYARLKSHQNFRSLLQDRVLGLPPAAHYTNLDF